MMSVKTNHVGPSLPERAVLGTVNRVRKIVRHGTKIRSQLRRGTRLVHQAAKVVRHAIMRRRFAWRGFRYRSRWTSWGAKAWRTVAFVKAPRETRERRRTAEQFTARVSFAEMPPANGYRLLAPNHFPEMADVMSVCQQIYESKGGEQEGAFGGRRMKGEFLRNLLTNDDLRRHPLLVDFALSDAALGMAAEYLGTIPYLNRVDLLYSVSKPGEDNVSSQLFHVDPEGLTQVKFFINVFDVGEGEGPFTFIPADDTARVIREVDVLRQRLGKPHAGRYLDDEIAAVGATDAIVRIMGPRGSGVAVDTSRCLHLGSRVNPGSFRLCLYVQYCTTRERGNVFDVDRYRRDPVRRLAVEHSLASVGETVSAPHQMGG